MSKCDAFFESLRGRTVTFCGIARSHMPLIRLWRTTHRSRSFCTGSIIPNY